MKKKSPNRRNFLKNAALLGWALPAVVTDQTDQHWMAPKDSSTSTEKSSESNRFSLLITSDIHAQIHTHDEFFWENGKAVYKKRGGLAVLKTMIDRLRKSSPNNILYDGGDFFHGHGVASLSEGEALIPLINAFQYDQIGRAHV